MNRTTVKRVARRLVGFVLAINLLAIASPAMAARVVVDTPAPNPIESDSGSWSSVRPGGPVWSNTLSGSWS